MEGFKQGITIVILLSTCLIIGMIIPTLCNLNELIRVTKQKTEIELNETNSKRH